MVTLSQPLLPASRLETELRGTSGLSWCSFTNCSSEINYPWDDSQYWLYNYAVALHWLTLRGACRHDGLGPGSASSCGKCQSLQAAFEMAPVEVAASSLQGTLTQLLGRVHSRGQWLGRQRICFLLKAWKNRPSSGSAGQGQPLCPALCKG